MNTTERKRSDIGVCKGCGVSIVIIVFSVVGYRGEGIGVGERDVVFFFHASDGGHHRCDTFQQHYPSLQVDK